MLEGRRRTFPQENADPTIIESLEVGMTFEAQAPDGSAQTIVVKKVEGVNVTIDINHPLAGVVLNFDIKILSVRESTEEERSHGHAH